MATTITATDVTMPQLGESVTEGTVGAWLKQPGDRVDKYDPLVEIESDKASSELPSPLTGTLIEILIEPGTTVPVGTALCRIDESGSATATDGSSAAEPTETPVLKPSNGDATHRRHDGVIPDEMELLHTRSSPFVRRIAEEHGIDITAIAGSGAGGRVTKRDVLAAVEEQESRSADRSTRAGAVAPDPRALGSSTPAEQAPAPANGHHEPLPVLTGDEVVPLTSMRRAIADTMVRSVTTAPQATVVMEVDMTAAVAWRAARKDAFREREGIELTYLPIVLTAVVKALRDHPRLNAAWDETRIIQRGEINIGVAVALDDGLVVPVIRHADRLSLSGLAHAVADLAGKARAGALTPDEMAGGTFTVNNPGTFGSLVSTPILVPGQVGILSTEAIVKRPVVVDDMIAIRSMMNLSLTIDHRALDGLAATRFLAQLRDWLETVDDARLS
jgi:2-oxoisovalerate dehydrogenase E2 component (dihydrolipoyl transacylase)